MRTLFSSLILSLLVGASCTKSAPQTSNLDRTKARTKTAQIPKPAESDAKSKSPHTLDCPPKTKAIESAQALGLTRYCRGELGKEGPFEIVDKAQRPVQRGHYKSNRRSTNVELFEEGVLTANAIIKEGKLEGLQYKTKAPIALKSNIISFLRAEISQTQSCTQASDCVVVNAPCPIACTVVINKNNQKRVEKWFKDFDAPCKRMCKKQSALTDCKNGQCVRKHH